MNQAVYKFPESNRRLQKLVARIRKAVLTTISSQGLQSLLNKCFITEIALSPDLSKTSIGIYGDGDIDQAVELLNNEQKTFNKALCALGTKRTPRCYFYRDDEYPKIQALQEALNKSRDDDSA